MTDATSHTPPDAISQAPSSATTEAASAVQGPFEPEFSTALCQIFEELITFNQVLGLKVDELRHEIVRAHLKMRPELVGHYAHNRLHGGVISATLDSMGGLAVMAAIGARHLDEPPQQRLQRFGKLGTIDLRIDYLRPAIGALFRCEAEVMRLGSRVANTRMAFTDEQGRLLATGAAAYIVS
ncbi:thioesterase family protein [Mitsuaria sp. GD03876]|uniref:thioesterase family protein n=1 Tax=Mitsuaria sp. GD03876 TaxID=2975399 RepID=UPI00244D2EB9|nr:thioesterase family protein [Mitsuaria sp. GD03876]MDH0866018.1 thioesterase family protein [Mitsuaria sp. GD03876]